MKFLGLNLFSEVPDEKTIWLYREVLTKGGTLEKLFDRFENYLAKHGYAAELGSIEQLTTKAEATIKQIQQIACRALDTSAQRYNYPSYQSEDKTTKTEK